MPEPLEEQYLDILQNIEAALIRVYRDYPAMTDADAQNAFDGVLRFYQAETKNRATPALRLSSLAQSGFDAIKTICDWRLGRSHLQDEAGRPAGPLPEPKTVDEIIMCLKRLRRSCEFWTKKGGRQGYLKYVAGFLE